MSAKVQLPAPDFKATALIGEQFKEIKLSDYKGKYVLLYFYPLDFTFVCPTEIIAFNDKLDEFKKRNTEVIGVSVTAISPTWPGTKLHGTKVVWVVFNTHWLPT